LETLSISDTMEPNSMMETPSATPQEASSASQLALLDFLAASEGKQSHGLSLVRKIERLLEINLLELRVVVGSLKQKLPAKEAEKDGDDNFVLVEA